MWRQKRILNKTNYDILWDDTVIGNEKVTKKTNKTITTEIASLYEDDELLDNGDDTILASRSTELTTNNTVDNKIT